MSPVGVLAKIGGSRKDAAKAMLDSWSENPGLHSPTAKQEGEAQKKLNRLEKKVGKDKFRGLLDSSTFGLPPELKDDPVAQLLAVLANSNYGADEDYEFVLGIAGVKPGDVPAAPEKKPKPEFGAPAEKGEVEETLPKPVKKKKETKKGQQEKLERFATAYSYFMLSVLNVDKPANLDKYNSAYSAMEAEEQAEFKVWMNERVEELAAIDPKKKYLYRAYFDKYLPGVLPEAILLNRMPLLVPVLEKYSNAPSGKKAEQFRFDDYVKAVQEMNNVVDSYLVLNSDIYGKDWSAKHQRVFLQVLKGDKSASEYEGTEYYTAADLASKMAGNMEVANWVVDSKFGWDWAEVSKVVLGKELTKQAKENPALAMARLHYTVLSDNKLEFDNAKNLYFTYLMKGATEVVDVGAMEEGSLSTFGNMYEAVKNMDLVTQYLFFTKAWDSIYNANLPYYQKTGDVAGAMEEVEMDPGAYSNYKVRTIELVMDQVSRYTSNFGYGGQLGFIMFAVPLAIEQSSSFNEVVDILGQVTMTSNTAQNTDAYAHVGAQHVLYKYTTEQVPRNFIEAAEDNYNQMLELMLENVYASAYTNLTGMDKAMWDVQTMREMLMRFMHLYVMQSGPVHPGEVLPHFAPQDFSINMGLEMMNYQVQKAAALNYGYPGFSDVAGFTEDERHSIITGIVDGQQDPMLYNWWQEHPDMHDLFFYFFSPSSVELIPEKQYFMMPMVPTSYTSLLMKLSRVEGLSRLLMSPEFAGATAAGLGGGGAFKYEQATGGEYKSKEAEGQWQTQAEVFGPVSTIGVLAKGDYEKGYEKGAEVSPGVAAPESEYEDANWYTQMFLNDIASNKFGSLSGYLQYTGAVDKSKVEETAGGATMLDETEDHDLIAYLNYLGTTYDTHAIAYIDVDTHTSKHEDSAGWTHELTADARVYSYAEIKGNWYRIGYIDVTASELEEFFFRGQVGPYGEVGVLAGQIPAEAEEGSKWEFYGGLVGLNLSAIIPPLSANDVYMAHIESKKKPAAQVIEEESVNQLLDEYALGFTATWKAKKWGGKGVMFTTGVYRAPVGEEYPKAKTGGAGTIVTVKGEGKEMAIAAAAEGAEQYADKVAVTCAWRTKNVIVDKVYTDVLVDVVGDVSARGLLGAMYDGDELKAFFTGFFDRASYINEDGEIDWYTKAGGLTKFQWDKMMVQASLLYSDTYLAGRRYWVDSQLMAYMQELAELRGGEAPGPEVGAGKTAKEMAEREAFLETEITRMLQLRTALGMMQTQKWFGTAKLKYQDKGLEAGVEALVGAGYKKKETVPGVEEASLLLNGFVEVPEKFAIAMNINPLPWGSAGGKVVIPISDFVLAATGGGYFGKDTKGFSAYGGLLYDAQKWGMGFIVGGSTKTTTLGEGAVVGKKDLAEVMILGWHPMGKATAQEYIALVREKDSNTFTLSTVGAETMVTWKVTSGTKIRWVQDNGTLWTVQADVFWKALGGFQSTGEVLPDGSTPVYSQPGVKKHTVGAQMKIEAGKGITAPFSGNVAVGLMLNVHGIEDIFLHPEKYNLHKVNVSGMGYLKATW